MKLYSVQRACGNYLMNWWMEPWLTTEISLARMQARKSDGIVVEVAVMTVKIITPKRRAKTADNEGKQMAKAKKAAPKAAKKVNGKKAKK
jgi:hypothetical protein